MARIRYWRKSRPQLRPVSLPNLALERDATKARRPFAFRRRPTRKAPYERCGNVRPNAEDHRRRGPRPLGVGTEVEFGVRPEHLRVGTGTEAGSSEPFDAIVDLVEPMGSDALLWLKVDGQVLSARVESSQRFTPGQPVTVRFRVSLASLFDAASGDRL